MTELRGGQGPLPSYGHIILTILNGLRRWFFLPILVVTAPLLVCFKGGDALQVSFNTIGTSSTMSMDILIHMDIHMDFT